MIQYVKTFHVPQLSANWVDSVQTPQETICLDGSIIAQTWDLCYEIPHKNSVKLVTLFWQFGVDESVQGDEGY